MPFWPRIQPYKLIKVSQETISDMDSSKDALKVGQISSYLCFSAKVLCTCQTFDMYSIPMYSIYVGMQHVKVKIRQMF